MSIQREYNAYLLTCDICQNTADTEFEFWSDAIDFVADKDNGWKRKFEDGGWTHVCPACQE